MGKKHSDTTADVLIFGSISFYLFSTHYLDRTRISTRVEWVAICWNRMPFSRKVNFWIDSCFNPLLSHSFIHSTTTEKYHDRLRKPPQIIEKHKLRVDVASRQRRNRKTCTKLDVMKNEAGSTGPNRFIGRWFETHTIMHMRVCERSVCFCIVRRVYIYMRSSDVVLKLNLILFAHKRLKIPWFVKWKRVEKNERTAAIGRNGNSCRRK